VDPDAAVAEPGEPAGVEPRPAAEIEDARRLPAEHVVMDPPDLRFDALEAAARPVVLLREVLTKHARAEARVVPGQLARSIVTGQERRPPDDVLEPAHRRLLPPLEGPGGLERVRDDHRDGHRADAA